MSEEKQPKFTRVGGLSPQVFVRGGTMSSKQSNDIAQFEANSNQRRAQQAQQQQIASAQHGPGSVASLRSRKLITQDSPRLVLWYKKHNQYCLSEITTVAKPSGDGMEMMFTLVCTRCLERRVPQGQAQLQIRESNRKFSIDDTKRGPKRVEFGTSVQVVQQCGTVTVEETVRCGACGWAVRIVDSKVEEV
jgi:hypothetical protein